MVVLASVMQASVSFRSCSSVIPGFVQPGALDDAQAVVSASMSVTAVHDAWPRRAAMPSRVEGIRISPRATAGTRPR